MNFGTIICIDVRWRKKYLRVLFYRDEKVGEFEPRNENTRNTTNALMAAAGCCIHQIHHRVN
jgi:hypothetical protein